MTVKELRIGNLVEYKITDKFDERKEWWEVSEIDDNDIHWLSKVDSNDEDFRPIELTEDILLKIGFNKGSDIISNLWFISINYKNPCPPNIDYDFILRIDKNNNFLIQDTLFEIKYLHQLQNLYFALTNKELNINL